MMSAIGAQAAALAAIGLLALPAAWGDTSGLTAPAGVNVTSPQFQGTGMLNASFGQCSLGNGSQIVNQIQQILQSRNGTNGSNSKNGAAKNSCSITGIPDQGTITQCSTYTLPNGQFNQAKYKQEQALLTSISSQVTACQTGFDNVKQAISCIQQQGNLLAQEVNSLSGVFQQNINNFAQNVSTLQSMETDRTNQLNLINQKLNGGGNQNSPGTTGEGLLAVRARLEGILGIGGSSSGMAAAQNSGQISAIGTNIGNDITMLNNQATSIVNQQNSLNEQAQDMTMALTGQCFQNQTYPTYHCPTVDSPPLSAEQFIICRYQQNQGLNANGQPQNNSAASADAQASANSLQSVIQQMMGDISSQATLPSSQQQVQSSLNQTIVAYTPQDLQNLFGSQLAGFNGRGIQVEAFIMQSIQNCYASAQNTVQTERTQSNSSLGYAAQQIQTLQRENSSDFSTALNAYAAEYAKDTAALTGQAMSLNVTACQTATPSVQVSCLQQIQQTLQNLDNGSATATTSISLPANNQSLAVTFSCSGIQGCITALQNASANVTQAQQQLYNFHKQYDQQADQSTQNFVTQMAQMMSAQTSSLQSQLQNINSQLAALGVTQGITFQPVTAEKLSFQQEANPPGGQGIPNMPQSMMNLIGGAAQPPMLNISGDDFSSITASLGQSEQQEQQNLQTVSSDQQALSAVPQQCAQTLVTNAETALQNDVNTITSSCTSSYIYCQHDTDLVSLVSAVQAAASPGGSIAGLDGNQISNIEANLAQGQNTCANMTNPTSQCAVAQAKLNADQQAMNSLCSLSNPAPTTSTGPTCSQATGVVGVDQTAVNSACGTGQNSNVSTCPAVSEAESALTNVKNIAGSVPDAGQAN